MKRVGITSSVVLFITLLALHAFAVVPVAIDDVRAVLPGAASYTHELEPVDHYVVKDSAGTTVGIAALTSAVPPPVRGYRGEIDVLVGIDLAGKITGVSILSHDEDPQYMKRVTDGGFLQKFVGRSVDRGFDDIEAVTGATISSIAVKKDIATAVFELHRQLIDSGVIGEQGDSKLRPLDLVAVAAVALLIALTIVVVIMPERRWLRYVLWILSAAVVGFWLNAPITIGTFVDVRYGIIPAYLPLLILFAFALIAPFIKGNLYCAYLCPFGALQECAGRLKLPKCNPPNHVRRDAMWLKWIVLLAAVFGIATGVGAFRAIEPFASCFAWPVAIATLVQALIVLVIALFLKRPWCNYFCPTGALLDLLCQVGMKIRRTGKKPKECLTT